MNKYILVFSIIVSYNQQIKSLRLKVFAMEIGFENEGKHIN